MKAFHEISAAFSNAPEGVTARNFIDQPVITPPQMLQKRPEITRNPEPVIAPTRYEGTPEGAPAEIGTIYRSNSTPVFLSPDSVGEQADIGDREPHRRPSMTRTERLLQEIKARMPRHCPACGSEEIAPLFWSDPTVDVWDCCRCAAIFSGRGD